MPYPDRQNAWPYDPEQTPTLSAGALWAILGCVLVVAGIAWGVYALIF
jgi:hypothetical protein